MANEKKAARSFGGPSAKPQLSLAEAADAGEATVTMLIPPQAHGGPVRLRLADHSEVLVPAGVQEVPAHLADHWYLAAAGATKHVKPALREAEKPTE